MSLCKPLFEHDCPHCTFLGTIDINFTESIEKGDVYICDDTLIFRLSDEGSDYYSRTLEYIYKFPTGYWMNPLKLYESYKS